MREPSFVNLRNANLGHDDNSVSVEVVLLDGFTKDNFGFAIGVNLEEKNGQN